MFDCTILSKSSMYIAVNIQRCLSEEFRLWPLSQRWHDCRLPPFVKSSWLNQPSWLVTRQRSPAGLRGWLPLLQSSRSLGSFSHHQFLPEASYGLRVLSSSAFVGLCVRVCVYQSRVCPRDNSSLIQARITTFGPEMENTLV